MIAKVFLAITDLFLWLVHSVFSFLSLHSESIVTHILHGISLIINDVILHR